MLVRDEFREKAKGELCVDDDGLLVRFRDDFRRVFVEYVGLEFTFFKGANSRTVFEVERDGKRVWSAAESSFGRIYTGRGAWVRVKCLRS